MSYFVRRILLPFTLSFSVWYFLISYVLDNLVISTWPWYMKSVYILAGVVTAELITTNLNNK